MTVGSKVKQLRDTRGWTMGQLANRASVSTGYLSRLERDLYKSPGMVVMKRIATAFSVSPDVLLDPDISIDADGKTIHVPGKPDVDVQMLRWQDQLSQKAPNTETVLRKAIDALINEFEDK